MVNKHCEYYNNIYFNRVTHLVHTLLIPREVNQNFTPTVNKALIQKYKIQDQHTFT